MAKKTGLKRYAQAVFELAVAGNEIDRWQADLEKIAAVARDKALVAALESPKIRLEDKMKALAARLTGVSPLALNLAGLLAEKAKFGMAGALAGDYQLLVNRYRGIEEAEVITAVPLDDKGKETILERLSAISGKKVILKTEEDSNILGGVVARMGGKLLDGSTRSRLAALKSSLAGEG